MKKAIVSLVSLICCTCTVSVFAADMPAPADHAAGAIAGNGAPDSARLEKELQQLDWKQFKSAVEAIPKLKADVDAYGPLGWQYVEANYKTYGWKKSIDKLDDAQKKQLAELIQAAKKSP